MLLMSHKIAAPSATASTYAIAAGRQPAHLCPVATESAKMLSTAGLLKPRYPPMRPSATYSMITGASVNSTQQYTAAAGHGGRRHSPPECIRSVRGWMKCLKFDVLGSVSVSSILRQAMH